MYFCDVLTTRLVKWLSRVFTKQEGKKERCCEQIVKIVPSSRGNVAVLEEIKKIET